MEREQATKFIYDLLRALIAKRGSDLFITAGFPPAMKIDSKMTPVSQQALTGQHTAMLVRSIMNDKQAAEFEATKECNFAIAPPGIGRFLIGWAKPVPVNFARLHQPRRDMALVAGAGPAVTAGGIFADLLRLCSMLSGNHS